MLAYQLSFFSLLCTPLGKQQFELRVSGCNIAGLSYLFGQHASVGLEKKMLPKERIIPLHTNSEAVHSTMLVTTARTILRSYQRWWSRQPKDALGIIGKIGKGKAQSLSEPQGEEKASPLIEDYPSGYPRFAAFVGAHGSFQVCRRFSNLRARLLLLKQDELSVLEMDLEELDREEPNLLYLGSRRDDKNKERQSILSKIDHTLAEYGRYSLANRCYCVREP